MKICLLYESTDEAWGGINTFFKGFASIAAEFPGVEIVCPGEGRPDIVLSAGHYRAPGRLLKPMNLRNCAAGRGLWNPLGLLSGGHAKTVFRLDGLRKIYSGESSKADETLLRNMPLASAAIFQSEYSRRVIGETGVAVPKQSKVILNGADSRIFFPGDGCGRCSGGATTLVSNSWSTNMNKGFKDIAFFSELEGVEVRHIGRWPDGVPSGKVVLLGAKKDVEIAGELKRADALLFPSRNEACPNAVCEALASGVPVLYCKGGGAEELCSNGLFGVPLPEDIGMPEAKASLDRLKKESPSLRERILESLDLFSMRRAVAEYISFFKGMLDL